MWTTVQVSVIFEAEYIKGDKRCLGIFGYSCGFAVGTKVTIRSTLEANFLDKSSLQDIIRIMAGFLSFIWVIVLIALPISIIKPHVFSRFFNATRTKNFLILGGILFVLSVLIGITAPTPEKDSSSATEFERNQQEKTVVTNPTQPQVEDVTQAPTETPTPTPTDTPTTVPTKKIVYPTSTPMPVIKAPIIESTGGSYPCNCAKTCPNISSCEEAQYLLNNCGCGARDGDKDGIACDGAPLHCQN